MAQNPGLDKETYKSKKNAFENKYAEADDAYKEYWAARKNVQQYDTEVLKKEKYILETTVRLENVKRALRTERQLKRQLESNSEINKETVFVKSGNDFVTADVNDPEQFSEPELNATKICLKDQSRCFPFKTENGKKVLSLSRQEVMIELQNLKSAKASYNSTIVVESKKRDALIENRSEVDSALNQAERNLDRKKKSLLGFIEKDESGINESFVDELANDSNKEMLFGSASVEASSQNTKGQLVDALKKNVFGKDSYGLLKDNSRAYQDMDQAYQKNYNSVTGIKNQYKLDAPSLSVVAPSMIMR